MSNPGFSEKSRNDTKAIPPSRLYARPPSSAPVRRHLRPPETPIKKAPLSLQPTTTPCSNKTSGNYKISSECHRRESLNWELAMETAGHFLGAMPPTEFLDAFLPVAPSTPPCPTHKMPFACFRLEMCENEMYDLFITRAKPFVKSMKFYDTHCHKDSKCDHLAPDVSLYRSDDKPDEDRITDFSKMEAFVELKSSPDQDPFCDASLSRQNNSDSPHYFENDSDASDHNRGQLASYLAALASCQFRTHAFCIFICGRIARFIRWDPSGAIVSARFDYTIDDTLPEFLWRYSHLPRRSRGYDDSVVPATLEEIKQIGYDLQAELKNNNEHHRAFFKMMIPARDDPSVEHAHIISYPPTYQRQSTFGRITRTTVAVDLETQELVFVKTYWRENVNGKDKEGDIYTILESHHVPHIAPFGHGNDVRNICTLAQTFRGERWACGSKELVPLTYYRMSLKVIGRPLYDFTCSKEFVQGVADAMTAHDVAFFVAGVLHRDISVGNIILTADGRGLLIDWDLCIKVENMKNPARRPDRTGTWEFMSVAILQNPNKQHDIADDRESAYHLLNWLALHYTKHDQIHNLQRFLVQFDEHFINDDGSVQGGDNKMSRLTMPLPITFTSCPNLNPLLQELMRNFAVRYREPSQAEYHALEQLEDEIKETNAQLHDAEMKLHDVEMKPHDVEMELHDVEMELHDVEMELQDSTVDVQRRTLTRLQDAHIAIRDSHMAIRDSHMAIRDSHIAIRDSHIAIRDFHVAIRDSHLRARNSHLRARESHPVSVYTEKMKLISERGWLVGVLRRHIDSDGWPENDTAKANPIGTGSLNKRDWEQSQISARLPVPKRQRLSVDHFEQDSSDPDDMDS